MQSRKRTDRFTAFKPLSESPSVQPLEKFGMSAADDVHVFVWNIDWESAVKDWPYQFANADYKVVMTPGEWRRV